MFSPFLCSDTDCLTDGSVAERIKTFMNQKVYEGQANKISSSSTSSGNNGIKTRPRRTTSESSGSNQDLKIVGDLPKELPSVRNLAFMFSTSGQRKSPEPLPRSSLNKVLFKNAQSPNKVVFFCRIVLFKCFFFLNILNVYVLYNFLEN